MWTHYEGCLTFSSQSLFQKSFSALEEREMPLVCFWREQERYGLGEGVDERGSLGPISTNFPSGSYCPSMLGGLWVSFTSPPNPRASMVMSFLWSGNVLSQHWIHCTAERSICLGEQVMGQTGVNGRIYYLAKCKINIQCLFTKHGDAVREKNNTFSKLSVCLDIVTTFLGAQVMDNKRGL